MSLTKGFDFPRPQPGDKNADGSFKFKAYEDYVEALVEWKVRQILLLGPVSAN